MMLQRKRIVNQLLRLSSTLIKKTLEGFFTALGIAMFVAVGFLAVQTPVGKVILDQTLTVVTENISKVEVGVEATVVLGDEVTEILKEIREGLR